MIDHLSHRVPSFLQEHAEDIETQSSSGIEQNTQNSLASRCCNLFFRAMDLFFSLFCHKENPERADRVVENISDPKMEEQKPGVRKASSLAINIFDLKKTREQELEVMDIFRDVLQDDPIEYMQNIEKIWKTICFWGRVYERLSLN